jgi:DNA polymerase-3 subunit gamma/tau
VNQGEFLDLIEIDAASNTSVDDVRELRDKINFSPNVGRFKVYVIDEVHMLSTSAFNALLKTLEEPPPHAMFVLATTEAHKIPVTVISRCQRHDFRRIPVEEIIQQLRTLAEAESITVSDEVLGLIARQATGSLRDAISILDQLASAEGEITADLAHQILGTSPDQAVLNLMDAILTENPGEGLTILHQSAERGNDPGQFARQVVSYLRNMLLAQMENADQIDVPGNVFEVIKKHNQQISTRETLDLIRIFNAAVNDKGAAWQPTLPLEMAFLEALNIKTGIHPPVQTQPRKSGEPAQEVTQVQPETNDPEQSPPQKAETPSKQEPLTVLGQWRNILERVREENPTTQGILNSCTPLGIKDNQLVLSFPSDLLKEKMEKGDHLEICQDMIEKVIGVRLPVICLVGGKDQSELPEGVDPDGLVAAVVRDLGGAYVSDDQKS